MNTFYALKKHQQHAYNQDGKRLLVTALAVGPLTVTQIKTTEKDGYHALQVGFGQKNRQTKQLAGHLKTAGITPKYIRELRLTDKAVKNVKDIIKVDEILKLGDKVSVHSVSIGKGFAGVVKRWNFAGGPKTHGQSDRHRAPGSIGQGTTPGRVFKGKKMAGRMGNAMTAVKGGQVVKIDPEAGILWITGTIPGKKNALVTIKKVKSGKFIGLYQEPKTDEVKAEEKKEAKVEEKEPKKVADKPEEKESNQKSDNKQKTKKKK